MYIASQPALDPVVLQGIGLVPFSPVASGLLSGKIKPTTEFEKVDDVRNLVPQLSRENIAGNQPIVDELTKWAEVKGATYVLRSTASRIVRRIGLRSYDEFLAVSRRLVKQDPSVTLCITPDELAALKTDVGDFIGLHTDVLHGTTGP